MYIITEDCVSCGTCHSVCPVKAIKIGFPYVITKKCIDCGKCAEACPIDAIIPGEKKPDNC